MTNLHLSTLILAASVIFGTGCQSEPEFAATTGEGSRTEETKIEYDARFPFPVWTDESGEMHFEFNEVKTPAANDLFANIVGKGWDIEKTYEYSVKEAHAGYPRQISFDEFNYYHCYVGNMAAPHYFIDSRDFGTIFSDITLIPGTVPDEQLGDRIKEIKQERFSYDETTGEVKFHLWSGFRVAWSTPTELWLYSAGSNCDVTIFKIKAASAEEVAGWHMTYSK